MGGIGSGRRHHVGAKWKTEELLAIDIRKWKRQGFIAPGQVFKEQYLQARNAISIEVEVGREKIHLAYYYAARAPVEQTVALAYSSCQFGGDRPWFICPGANCGRRAALLYVKNGFACRVCHELAYTSQGESAGDRAARRADSLRRKLGWKPGIFNGLGDKPKGMHWKTYIRLVREHNELSLAACNAMAERFNH